MAENRKYWIYPEIRETEKPTLFYLEDNRVAVLTHITEMDVQNLFSNGFLFGTVRSMKEHYQPPS